MTSRCTVQLWKKWENVILMCVAVFKLTWYDILFSASNLSVNPVVGNIITWSPQLNFELVFATPHSTCVPGLTWHSLWTKQRQHSFLPRTSLSSPVIFHKSSTLTYVSRLQNCVVRRSSWLRHCATSLKVAVSIHNGVSEICYWHNPSAALWLWVRLNVYQKWATRDISWRYRQPALCADKLTTFMCRLFWNMEALTSWNPQGLSRPVHVWPYFNKLIDMKMFLYTLGTSFLLLRTAGSRVYQQQPFSSLQLCTDLISTS